MVVPLSPVIQHSAGGLVLIQVPLCLLGVVWQRRDGCYPDREQEYIHVGAALMYIQKDVK